MVVCSTLLEYGAKQRKPQQSTINNQLFDMDSENLEQLDYSLIGFCVYCEEYGPLGHSCQRCEHLNGGMYEGVDYPITPLIYQQQNKTSYMKRMVKLIKFSMETYPNKEFHQFLHFSMSLDNEDDNFGFDDDSDEANYVKDWVTNTLCNIRSQNINSVEELISKLLVINLDASTKQMFLNSSIVWFKFYEKADEFVSFH